MPWPCTYAASLGLRWHPPKAASITDNVWGSVAGMTAAAPSGHACQHSLLRRHRCGGASPQNSSCRMDFARWGSTGRSPSSATRAYASLLAHSIAVGVCAVVGPAPSAAVLLAYPVSAVRLRPFVCTARRLRTADALRLHVLMPFAVHGRSAKDHSSMSGTIDQQRTLAE